MKNKFIFLIMLILLSSLVYGSGLIFRQNDIIDLKIPCFDEDNNFCNINTTCVITINNPSGVNLVDNTNMTRTASYYNYTLNSTQTTDSGIHHATMQCAGTSTNGFDRFTFEITPSGKEQKTSTAGISVVFFVMLIVFFLLFMGFKERHTTNILVDLIIRRSCFVLAIYMMILNSTIVATIAGSSNLDVTRELFTYVNIFGYVGYISMIYLMFKTIVDYLSLLQQKKDEKRMGGTDE